MVFARCREQLTLTDDELAYLRGLPDAMDEVEPDPECELETGHTGAHLTLGRALEGDREVWVRWSAGERGMLVEDGGCPAEDVESEDGWVCELPADHTGRHTFELEAGGHRELTPTWQEHVLAAARRLHGEDESFTT